jgi:hypothetical protein
MQSTTFLVVTSNKDAGKGLGTFGGSYIVVSYLECGMF